MILLLFQSVSAIIMHNFDEYLSANIVVAFFIPMLVGTGGNAGNQPGVTMTRALASGLPSTNELWGIIFRESFISIFQASILASVCYARVLVQFPNHQMAASTIALSLFLVVLFSAFLGIFLSLILHFCEFDPANSAAPITSTISDVVGIFILCLFTAWFLGDIPDPPHDLPISEAIAV